ncbi:MAG: MFS transporter [Parachlamydiales bacterium]
MNKNYKWIALSCTSLGVFFSVLSGGTLIVAFPSIMKDLNASLAIIMWMFIGYMLALTILVPFIGRLADIYGRKNLFVSGFFIFTLASLFCALSKSANQLLIYRMLQSVGGALLVGTNTAIVADAFGKENLGKALGINSMVIGIASIIGPIIGGILVESSWRNIFYINVFIGFFGTLWSFMQLKEIYIPSKIKKIDYLGTFVFTIAILSFLFGFSLGGFFGWLSPFVIISIICSIILFYVFIKIENNCDYPMMEIKLIKNKLLGFAYSSNLLNAIARGAITFLLVFYFHIIKGMDTIQAGIMLTPFAIAMMISSPICGVISDKYGTRILSFLGLLISAFGLIGFISISQTTTLFELGFWMSIMGIGSGMFFSPNSTLIMSSIPADKRGIASGIRIMTNNGGMMLSFALSMAIIASSIDLNVLQDLIVNTKTENANQLDISNFITGLRIVFSISFALNLFAAVLSFIKTKKPVWDSAPLDDLEKSTIESEAE